jgi:6-pyruvoyltetrahydropterin/6-carboxytetrahydropterin synthase
MKKSYRVLLTKEQLTFSAAHFITFNRDVCESLHGHNYGVRCEVAGELTSDRYVVDFILLRDMLNQIVRDLDHRVLLPTRHESIQVQPAESEVTVTFQQRRWVFPSGDCRLLPVVNTTAEELAALIGERLIEALRRQGQSLAGIHRIEVGVDENQGQWGCCAIELSGRT